MSFMCQGKVVDFCALDSEGTILFFSLIAATCN